MTMLMTGEVSSEMIDPYGRATLAGYNALADGEVALLADPGSYSELRISRLTIAKLLLQNPSIAVMHFEKPAPDTDQEEIAAVMMAVNYHNSHREGRHKIIVQDPSRPEDGQWMLWTPPGARNKTFYRRALTVDGQPCEFETLPVNTLKINEYALHAGPSDEAVTSFTELGFEFEDRVLSPLFDEDEYDRLSYFSEASPDTWNPYRPE